MSKENLETNNDTAVAEKEEQNIDAVDSSASDSVNEELSLEKAANDVNHIVGLASTNPEIAEMPEVKEMLEKADKAAKGEVKKEVKEEVKEDKVEEVKEEVEEKVTEDKDDDDIFGFGLNKKTNNEINFKDDSDFKNHIKEKYSINDYNKFLNSVDKWRNDSQAKEEAESNYEKLVDGLGSLPQPIKDAIDAFAKAKDYKEAFHNATPKLDFNKDADDFETKVLVGHYFKSKIEKQQKKLDDGDIYQDDFDEYVEDLKDSAERLFRADKKDWDAQRADIVRREEERTTLLKDSAASSVDSLKEKYPNFSNNELKKIRTRLVQQDINNLFYDRNGKFRQDAAERIALALYGDKLISTLRKKSVRDGETKANLENVARGKERLSPRGNQNSVGNQAAKDAVSYLQGQFKKDPYS
jgi:hypothetical protein